MESVITNLILFFGVFNLIRLTLMMVAADLYDTDYKVKSTGSYPMISVLIPAYNEEDTIEKTVLSVDDSNYLNFEIIVIDDGSKDQTSTKVKKIIADRPKSNIRLIKKENGGKGSALNRGIDEALGELIMVLDADSTIEPDALFNCIKYFEDDQVQAIASNVRIINDGSLIGFMQKIEYLLSYRMKGALTTLNMEYIIGGVGSVYRADILRQVGGYRHNTITEDIDLSMKVVELGNKVHKVIYADDVKTATVPVLSIGELVKQRYRWKSGRLQAFIRYRKMFLSTKREHGKMLSWFQLPYALFGEVYLALEPIFVTFILSAVVIYSDFGTLTYAALIMLIFLGLNFLATNRENWFNKAKLVASIPLIYPLLYVISYVELKALILSLANWRKLNPETEHDGSWVHVARPKTS